MYQPGRPRRIAGPIGAQTGLIYRCDPGIDILDRRMPFLVRADELARGFSQQVRQSRRFYLDLLPHPGSSLSVVCGGWERCAPEYAIKFQHFGNFAIELVVSGKVSVELSGRQYMLGAGGVLAYGPGVLPDFRAISGDPPLKYFMHFAGARARGLLGRARLPVGAVRQLPNASMLRELCDALISAGLRRTAGTPVICATLLEVLLLTIGDSAVEYAPAETGSYATYRRCRDWLEQHGSELGNAAEGARRCHVDPAYLCRLFRRYDRETPYQLLLRLRMQRAAALLQQPGALVKTVAADLGFSDAFHFSRAFKRHFGVPPSRVANPIPR
jgi:AraC-like DNA-binding protein